MRINELIQQLQHTQDWERRAALFDDIVAFGVEAIPLLIETLALFPDAESYFGENSDAGLHSITENLLAEIGKPAVDYLIPLLKSNNWGMRYGAIWVLDHLHDVRAIEPMIESLDSPQWDETGVGIDHETIDALRNFGEFALEPLISALHHENACIRGNVAFILRDFDDPRLPSMLMVLAEHDPESFVRSQAAFALGKFPNSGVVQTLIRLTDDPDQEVRSSAIIALEHFPDDAVTQVLTRLTQDSDAEISELATDILDERQKNLNQE